MAASVDTRSTSEISGGMSSQNIAKHSSPHVSRSRKRKQTHTPRSDQDSDECEFIEYRYAVPFENQIEHKFAELSTTLSVSDEKTSQLCWSNTDTDSDSNSGVSDTDMKMDDCNETRDSCIIIKEKAVNLCKNNANESEKCTKNIDFTPSMGMTVHLVPAQKTNVPPILEPKVEAHEQVMNSESYRKTLTPSPSRIQRQSPMSIHVDPELANGAPNSDILEDFKENEDIFHSEFDSSQQYHRTVLSAGLRPKTKRRKRNYLAGALGLTMDDLSQDVVLDRKRNIHMKLRQGGILRFTLEEEFDIHSRAEAYSLNIVPDLSYYVIPSDKGNGNATFADFAPSVRKRRKHLAVIDNYILISPLDHYYPEYDNMVTLSNGVKLMRPPTKLVELVAEAINDSPDGMLQVQQVYLSLQNRYPFYRYMDKASITSWRSSIRHALYQKWFKKIAFGTELINCKGCYWAINRKQKPKEWMMPPRREQPVPPEYYSDGGLDDGDFYSPTTLDHSQFDTSFLRHSTTDDQDLEESGDDELMAENAASTEQTPYNVDMPSMALSTSKGSLPSRDPDPMFNMPSMSQKSELHYDIVVNNDAPTFDSLSTGSDDATLDAWGYAWPSATNHAISDDDSGYFGQMPWCASDTANAFTESSTYDQYNFPYQAPLLPPTMVPYPVVPPLEFADIDTGYISEFHAQDHNSTIADNTYEL